MAGMLRHRGPDEAGIYIGDGIGFAHTRLSIIDLSSGTQPVHNEDRSMWIIYNGEIFNYPELRKQLEIKRHKFYTTSDTEVLLHMYEEYGPACLEQLNGQFAFAIWNERDRTLFLARDHVGILPLYYTVNNGTFVFGSEIKALFALEGVPRKIDPIAMSQIFTFWTTLKGRTAFENVFELAPGHYMMVSDGQISAKKYWDVPFVPRSEQLNLSTEEICGRVRELLLDSVRIRLRADVPVGAYMSGGLDSSGITALVVQNFDSDVTTFGIRFEESAFDEGKHQNRMAKFLKTRHSELQATNDAIGASFADCLWYCEKPVLRTAPVPLFLLSGLVREKGLKVVLTGEGADEIFGGYNIFREAKVRKFWARQPGSKMRAALISQLYPYIFRDNARAKQTLPSFFGRGFDQVDDPLFSHLVRWDNTSRIKTFFSAQLTEAVKDYDGYGELRGNLPEDFRRWDCVSQAQYLEIAIFLSNYLLSSQGDRVAMGHSLEIRPPYLDKRIIEFMGRVPSKWKIIGMDEKHILKKCFSGVIPDEIARRPKHPYRAPIKQSLLSGKTTERTMEMLSEKSLKESGLFDSGKVGLLLRKIRNADLAGEMDSMALVGIVSSQIIYEQFIRSFHERIQDPLVTNLVFDRRSAATGGKN
jgi:asparagine synthase (glutamine-hydrolysing)